MELLELDQLAVWHPFTQMQTAEEPKLIVRGELSRLYDHQGKCYIDAISSWWVNLHGHAHPYIVEKLKEQAEQLEHVIFADFTHAPAIQLAGRLLELLPGSMNKLFYSDNGSTAVEAALKMAFQYWYNRDPETDRKGVICFQHSYHGDTFGAMSAAGKSPYTRPFWSHFFKADAIIPPFKGREKESLNQMQALLSKGGYSSFIFEPLVLGAGGMQMYASEGLDDLIALCREHQVLTIADEVMTGFGRTGPLFASERLVHKPDMICLSKGITGGFLPLGATACTKEIYEAFLDESLEKAFLHGHSYTGNPLACSAGLASLDLLLAPSCLAQRHMIEEMHRDFCRIWMNHPRLKRCESIGTILAVEFKAESKSSYFDPLGKRLYRRFLNKGILLRPLGNVVYVMPPYCISAKELDSIYYEISLTFEEL